VDGTLNKKGTITSYVEADLQIGERVTKTRLYITGLGKQKVILGFPWLRDENPDVDWKTGKIRWKKEERRKLGKRAIELTRARLANLNLVEKLQKYPVATIEDALNQEEDRTHSPIPDWYPPDAIIITAEEQENFEDYAQKLLANPASRIHKTMKCLQTQVNRVDINIGQIEFNVGQEEFDDNALLISYINGKATKELNDIWINSTMSHSQAFAEKYEGNVQDEQLDLKEAVPLELHEYLDVFSDEKASQFPKSTPWDHKIKLKEGFQPKSFKLYPMTPEEDAMTKEFVNDNLAKGYIRPSKSPMATPFFFIHKKGTTKY